MRLTVRWRPTGMRRDSILELYDWDTGIAGDGTSRNTPAQSRYPTQKNETNERDP